MPTTVPIALTRPRNMSDHMANVQHYRMHKNFKLQCVQKLPRLNNLAFSGVVERETENIIHVVTHVSWSAHNCGIVVGMAHGKFLNIIFHSNKLIWR